MYDESKLSGLIGVARLDPSSAVIDAHWGDGGWTCLISSIVGPKGRVYRFMPAEVAHVVNGPIGRMRTQGVYSDVQVRGGESGRRTGEFKPSNRRFRPTVQAH